MRSSEPDAFIVQPPPWQRPWPKELIEMVQSCPVCASTVRNILFSDVIDNTFLTAAGRWTLCQCGNCATAYLNPRPTQESIAKAYETYYTHENGKAQLDSANLGLFRKLRRMFANGYINKRYGTRRIPSIERFALLAEWLPIRSVADSQFRYLPKPSKGNSLLDIGCGNGDFLFNAIEMGWEASGLDPDHAAVEVARARGLQVFSGTISDLADLSSYYDAVTLSHVIEHVHQPHEFLQSVNRLLKTDGVVYIDTPNIQSYGAKIFKKCWRGIEAPRHLTIFNPRSLKDLLLTCGFNDVLFLRRTDVQSGMYESSKKISEMCTSLERTTTASGLWGKYLMQSPFVKTDCLEYITIVARKKGS